MCTWEDPGVSLKKKNYPNCKNERIDPAGPKLLAKKNLICMHSKIIVKMNFEMKFLFFTRKNMKTWVITQRIFFYHSFWKNKNFTLNQTAQIGRPARLIRPFKRFNSDGPPAGFTWPQPPVCHLYPVETQYYWKIESSEKKNSQKLLSMTNNWLFNIQVTYEGEASYPNPKPTQGLYGAPSNAVQNQGYIYWTFEIFYANIK